MVIMVCHQKLSAPKKNAKVSVIMPPKTKVCRIMLNSLGLKADPSRSDAQLSDVIQVLDNLRKEGLLMKVLGL